MSAGKIAIGVLAGVAVGAILGVLFAPDKGSETRKKLSKKGNDLVDQVKEKFQSANEEIHEMADKAKNGFKDYKKDSKVEQA